MTIEPVAVPDPFEPSKTIQVRRNVSTDPIEYLAARKYLNTAQKVAADRFLAIWETAAFSSTRTVDLSRERVDADTMGLTPSDRALDAQTALVKVRRAVGRSGYTILVAICGERQTIGNVAAAFYERSRRAEFLVRTRLVETLEELAEFWGYIGSGGNKPSGSKKSSARS